MANVYVVFCAPRLKCSTSKPKHRLLELLNHDRWQCCVIFFSYQLLILQNLHGLHCRRVRRVSLKTKKNCFEIACTVGSWLFKLEGTLEFCFNYQKFSSIWLGATYQHVLKRNIHIFIPANLWTPKFGRFAKRGRRGDATKQNWCAFLLFVRAAAMS